MKKYQHTASKQGTHKVFGNYLEAKEKQGLHKKAEANKDNNKTIINVIVWQLIMTYCSLNEIGLIFATSKCFIVFKDMDAAIFKSGFANSIQNNHNLANLSVAFRNKVIKYVKPAYDCLCECSKNISEYCCTKCVDIPLHDICNDFIRHVNEGNVPQVKFILNIYGIHMREMHNYMPEYKLQYKADPSLDIFKALENVVGVKYRELYNTSIHYPFVIIPFVLGNEKIAHVVLSWIREVNRHIVNKRLDRYHAVFKNEIMRTGVISIGYDYYGSIDAVIQHYNDSNGWNLYELYKDVKNASISIYNGTC
jgi:hypothetical protein